MRCIAIQHNRDHSLNQWHVFTAFLQNYSADINETNLSSALGNTQIRNWTSVGTFCLNSTNNLSQVNSLRSCFWSRSMELCDKEHSYGFHFTLDGSSYFCNNVWLCLWHVGNTSRSRLKIPPGNWSHNLLSFGSQVNISRIVAVLDLCLDNYNNKYTLQS